MYQPSIDLAGEVCFNPNFWQTKTRINYLINQYLSNQELSDRLEDLPDQFRHCQPRKWSSINWQDINSEQVIGLELEIFLLIIKGILVTEAPIRALTQTSKQYLEQICPSIAKLVGGISDQGGKIIELGLWELEKSQHKPALSKIYQQLSQQKISWLNLQRAKSYQPKINPYQDLYRHGLEQVTDKCVVVCLYLWLMAHTTGTLQKVLGELLQDEINHLGKFWGVGMWLYPEGAEQLICSILSQINTFLTVSYRTSSNHELQPKSTWHSLMTALFWQLCPLSLKGELIYTFFWTLKRIWQWSSQLTPEYLHSCCATPEFFGNNDVECHQPEIIII
ncbi:MAG: ferritin-like domain-containing protein [Cyanobacteria bacterium J06621_8]